MFNGENWKLSSMLADDICKDGCRSFNNSFYYISSKKKSWDDSRQDCKNRGADLVVVNSKEEQVKGDDLKILFPNIAFSAGCLMGLEMSQTVLSTFGLQVFISSLKDVFWLGLTDRENQGTWKWVDDSVLNSTG